MYYQINLTETFRERQLALLEEAERRRLARRMRSSGGAPKARSGITAAALGFLAVLVVAGLMLAASGSPAHASIFYTLYTVNQSTDAPDANPGNALCDTNPGVLGEQCTLRAAIQESNASTGAAVIAFNIPGSGVHTISPNTDLPYITDTVIIDGYSQPGASVNTLKKGTNAKLMIELDGSQAGIPSFGILIRASDVVVKGLVIKRFNDSGILVDDAAANTSIEGNFIGTEPSGTKAQGVVNGSGVQIEDTSGVTNNTVGGSVLAARNLISGNNGPGISLHSNGNKVLGNLIGTQRDGKGPLGNSWSGLYIHGDNNIVGKATPRSANIIAFNGNDGIAVLSFIGETNVGNSIISNSIFSNDLLGTDLGNYDGPTPNDLGDADAGSNDLQNYPVITSAKKSATGKTTIKGTLNSTPTKTFTVQFFSNPKGTNEGKKLIMSKSVSTDGSGNAPFTFSTKKAIKVGQNMTATATNNSTGDTSEFSAPKKVVAS